jgi:glycine cleavage system aminomethyltransferase T
VERGRSTGRVTSARLSERVGTVIGLAYVDPARAVEGETLSIRIRGVEHPARVTLTPFYDPDGILLRS